MLLKVLSLQANGAAAAQAFALFRKHRSLILAMTRRELVDRYAGQIVGAAWAIITPLLLMGTYVWVFTYIFKGRLGETDITGSAFTAYLLCGLAPWVALADGLGRGSTAVSSSSNLVKQIVFPSEILPLKVALATLPTLFIGLGIAIAISISAGRATLFGLLVQLPVAIVSYVVFLSGCCYFLSAVGVFFRDLKDVTGFFLSVGLFLHPILYPPGAGPTWLQAWFPYSPISHMVWCFHQAIIGPIDPHPWSWAVFPAWAVLSFLIGWRTFRALKPTFGNAL